ncbi:MAG: D-tyrosyl-tRNA(Tyr) deacylase [Romboutsia sp.]|jgi:D-tyrosyl-tRNA(Tyr) deacylase|nr:D-tyrosyl-tRNA(Tyr) deacylase [Romboutsia sp.]
MRAVVQRVSSSKVTVDGNTTGEIKRGLLVLLGVTHEDTSKDVDYIIDKVLNLRIFEDENEKMNLSLKDVEGELLVVSQFTLYGDCRKGRRPSFSTAARPELATKLYEEFIEKSRKEGIVTQTGQFGAHMMVDLTNDGPVTILLESNRTF